MDSSFYYDRYTRGRTSKVIYVIGLVLFNIVLNYILSCCSASVVLHCLPDQGKDVLFYGGVLLLFLQLSVIYVMLLDNKVHWSTAIAWACGILASGLVVIG